MPHVVIVLFWILLLGNVDHLKLKVVSNPMPELPMTSRGQINEGLLAIVSGIPATVIGGMMDVHQWAKVH